MGRRKNADPAPTPAHRPAEVEIVPDGDFAGMRYEDVTDRIIGDVTNAYAPLTLEGVCMVHDYILQEILDVCSHARGVAYASDVAQQFQQTLEPYLRQRKLAEAVYHELLELKRKRSGD